MATLPKAGIGDIRVVRGSGFQRRGEKILFQEQLLTRGQGGGEIVEHSVDLPIGQGRAASALSARPGLAG